MNIPGEERFIFKLILTGNEKVGKTSLRKRFMGMGFQGTYKKTIGVDLSYLKFKKGNEESDLVIWDIAGDAHFRNNRKLYYKGSNGAFLVIDVTTDGDIDTYVKPWVEDYINERLVGEIKLAIIFNKMDLEDQRKVFKDKMMEIENYVKTQLGMDENDVKTFETSAVTGEGVKDAFEWLIERMAAQFVN